MKIRNLLPLAALGGLLYLHRRRGGEWSVDSFRESLEQLWHGVQAAADKAKAEATRELRDIRSSAEATARDLGNTGSNGRIR